MSEFATKSSQSRTPSTTVLLHAAKIAIVQDRPIMMDYWNDAVDKVAFVGVKPDGDERLLVKNGSEYTSPISKIFKVGEEYIISTENSLYIVPSDIGSKYIS